MLSPADWQAVVSTFVFFACLPVSIVCAGYTFRVTRRYLEPATLIVAGSVPAIFGYSYCQVVIGCYPGASSSAVLRPSLLILSLSVMALLIIFTRLAVSLDRRVMVAMIGEKERLEQDHQMRILLRQMELAEEYRQYQSEVSTNVSHELRTATNIILGFSEPGLADIQYMPLIHRGAKRMRDVIDNMSALLRLEANRPLIKMPVDLAEVSEESIHGLKINADHLSLRSDLESVIVYGSYDALVLAVTDIIHNAIKFTPAGEVLVQSYPVETGGFIVVTDTGIGIPEEYLGRIFERFFQVNSSAIRPYPGVGLGLYIASEIVSKHNGWISVDSEVGEGSAFTVYIPEGSEDVGDE